MVKSEWVSQQMEGGASPEVNSSERRCRTDGGWEGRLSRTGQLTDGSRISAKPRMQAVERGRVPGACVCMRVRAVAAVGS